MKKFLLTAVFALAAAAGSVFAQEEGAGDLENRAILLNGVYDFKNGAFGFQYGGGGDIDNPHGNRFFHFFSGGLLDYTRYSHTGAPYNELLSDVFFGVSLFGIVSPFIAGGIGGGWDSGVDDSLRFAWKIGAGAALTLGPVMLNAVYSYNGHTDATLFVGAGFRLNVNEGAPSSPRPNPHPTITPEELRRVELAYAQTARNIEARGKRLKIANRYERNAFIQRYQGSPNTAQVNAARNTKLEWYDIRTTSQEDIVALAKKEPNPFLKVRMIHDWVADVFAYDHDLLWWMDNVSGRNAEFTLGEIVRRQRGVCYEYAILFWFLMDAAGLDVYLISDFSAPNIGHAYNMVVIDGTGYVIDTTWDSGNRYTGGRITKFDKMNSKDYFMPNVSRSYKLRGW